VSKFETIVDMVQKIFSLLLITSLDNLSI